MSQSWEQYCSNGQIDKLGHFVDFWPIFGRTRIFPKNLAPLILASYGTSTSSKISKILMSESSLVPSLSFRYKRSAKKRHWNTSNTWLEFAQIESIFFRINYGIRGWWYWKYLEFAQIKGIFFRINYGIRGWRYWKYMQIYDYNFC